MGHIGSKKREVPPVPVELRPQSYLSQTWNLNLKSWKIGSRSWIIHHHQVQRVVLDGILLLSIPRFNDSSTGMWPSLPNFSKKSSFIDMSILLVQRRFCRNEMLWNRFHVKRDNRFVTKSLKLSP